MKPCYGVADTADNHAPPESGEKGCRQAQNGLDLLEKAATLTYKEAASRLHASFAFYYAFCRRDTKPCYTRETVSGHDRTLVNFSFAYRCKRGAVGPWRLR